jgi:hypothetical protein
MLDGEGSHLRPGDRRGWTKAARSTAAGDAGLRQAVDRRRSRLVARRRRVRQAREAQCRVKVDLGRPLGLHVGEPIRGGDRSREGTGGGEGGERGSEQQAADRPPAADARRHGPNGTRSSHPERRRFVPVDGLQKGQGTVSRRSRQAHAPWCVEAPHSCPPPADGRAARGAACATGWRVVSLRPARPRR